MYNDFEYYTPTRVIFGKGAESRTGELVRSFGGTKVLVHYGSGSVQRSGLLGRVLRSLDDAGIAHVELGGVVPNPRLSKVYEGIELGRREAVDFILAVGGGSVIDSAKAIAVGIPSREDAWDHYFIAQNDAEECLPVASVLTIAAAGSEMSNGGVIANESNGLKRDYCRDIMRPRFAVMDPELTMTLPDYQTACGAADIMMHTMERWFSRTGTMELTDGIAAALMKTVMKYAPVLKEDPSDYGARAELMWAGSLSHNDLTGCGGDGGDWTTHNMEHEMGGLFDVAHGAGLAAIWGSWARYVHRAAPDRFVKFAVEVMGVKPEGDTEAVIEAGIRAVEDWYREIGMPTNMRELGIAPTEEQILLMAERCEFRTGGAAGTVMPLKKADMAAIFRAAL